MSYFRLIRPGLLATGVALVVMVALSVWAYGQLPERVPMHWNAAGEVDGWGSRTAALITAPLVLLGVGGMIAAAPLIEPREKFERTLQVYQVGWLGVVVLLTIVHGAVLLAADSPEFPVTRMIMASAGGLFLVVGYSLGKVGHRAEVDDGDPGARAGSASEARTNRLGGRLFMLLGAAVVVSAPVLPVEVVTWGLIGGSVGIAFVLVAYKLRE